VSVTPCTARRSRIPRMTGLAKQMGRRVMLAATLVASAAGAIAEEAWVRVAASPQLQVFVDDAGSLTRDAHGLVSVWTNTLCV
jgi:hypothetical protein